MERTESRVGTESLRIRLRKASGGLYESRNADVGGVSGKFTRQTHHNPDGRSQLVVLGLIVATIGASGAFQVYVAGTQIGSLLVNGAVIFGFGLVVAHALYSRSTDSPRWPILALVLTCLIPLFSAYWSQFPSATLKAAAMVIALAITGTVIARHLSMDERLYLLASTIGILLVLSVVAVIFDPSTAVDYDIRGPAFRGIFPHKNTLGRLAALEVVLSIALLANAKYRRTPLWWVVLLLASFVLYKAQSQTSLVAALITCTTLVLLSASGRTIRPKTLVAAIFGTYLAVSGAIRIIGPEVAVFLSRDETLTGRTKLWEISEHYAEQNYLGGWGFGAVWVKGSVLAQNISAHLTFAAGSAHNGMLDMRLQIGWIGFLSVVSGIAVLLYGYLRTCKDRTSLLGPLGITVLVLTMDLTESTLFFSLVWFVLWVLLTPSGSGHKLCGEKQPTRADFNASGPQNLQAVKSG